MIPRRRFASSACTSSGIPRSRPQAARGGHFSPTSAINRSNCTTLWTLIPPFKSIADCGVAAHREVVEIELACSPLGETGGIRC